MEFSNCPSFELKTKNILLFDNGDVRLCDFQWRAAEYLQNNGDKRTFWFAPEKIQEGNTPTGNFFNRISSYNDLRRFQVKDSTKCKSDVWSLGIAIYEMATGNEPFANVLNNFHLAKKIFDSDLIQLPETCPKAAYDNYGHTPWSDDFRDFVCKCLVRDVDKRFSAAYLLKHPWLANDSATPKQEKGLIIDLIRKHKKWWQMYLKDKKLQEDFELQQTTNAFVFDV
ncbi:serine/threonine-protein kinase 3 [Reticulomyxa filosa]|uniref:mitogen-activated protein kinase kinase n=1 Tax=Reticulomyxa filosa TaxID=46433 RepID=X6N714_RETFI|nr:serine/threonine-protein kinase 3 [Reticulomyxa filosa]|eukprot:ETO21097.1 serine/threonine-protein kinase 3 [Reticulomyxa filosa]